MHLFSVLEDHVHTVSKMTRAVADQLAFLESCKEVICAYKFYLKYKKKAYN